MHYHDASPVIARLVDASSRTLVASHANPDADAIASLLSFRHAFEASGRSITVAIGDGSIPATLAFLPQLDELTLIDELDISQFDLIVLLDCADEFRLSETLNGLTAARERGIPIVNIDHHVTNSRFGDVNLVDPDAAATCEMLVLLYQDLGITLDAALATTLMTGIQGDTLGLRTPSTTGQTLEVSADLLRAGADLDTIVDHLFRIRPFTTLKLWGFALSEAQLHGDLVWCEITPELLERSGADESEGEGIVNFLAGTKGARAAALLYRKPDGWRVSLRSLSDEVDVAKIAAEFGGGGHSRAAGCRLDGDERVRNQFLATVSERVLMAPTPAPG